MQKPLQRGGAVRRRAGRETEKRTSVVAHPKSVDRSGQASAKDRKITHTKAASAAYGAGRQNTRYGLYSSDRPSGPSLRSRCSITVYHINIGFARIFSILLEFYRKTSRKREARKLRSAALSGGGVFGQPRSRRRYRAAARQVDGGETATRTTRKTKPKGAAARSRPR